MRSAVKRYSERVDSELVSVSSKKGGKHRLLEFENNEKVRLMLKSSPFRTFTKQFEERLPKVYERDFDGEVFEIVDGDLGESINMEELVDCLDNGVDRIVAVYESGGLYELPVEEWNRFRMKYGTVRVAEESGEKTCSVPRKIMEEL